MGIVESKEMCELMPEGVDQSVAVGIGGLMVEGMDGTIA